MRLENKICIVTGGSKGIGAAICSRLAKEGVNLLINYNKSKREAENLEESIKSIYKIKCFTYRADVSDWSQVTQMVEFCLSKFDRIDIVVNNAGIKGSMQDISGISNEEYEKIMSINLKGLFNICKATVPYMIRQREGCIVNISSIAGVMGASVSPVYAASKAGVIGFSLALAAQLSPYDIRVNVVAPGAIETEWWSESKEIKEKIVKSNPLRRFGNPEEVADVVAFVIKNDYINAAILPIDGGRHAFKNIYYE